MSNHPTNTPSYMHTYIHTYISSGWSIVFGNLSVSPASGLPNYLLRISWRQVTVCTMGTPSNPAHPWDQSECPSLHVLPKGHYSIKCTDKGQPNPDRYSTLLFAAEQKPMLSGAPRWHLHPLNLRRELELTALNLAQRTRQ